MRISSGAPRVSELRGYNKIAESELVLDRPLKLRAWWFFIWIFLEPIATMGDLLEKLGEALTGVRSAYYDYLADTPD